MLRGRAEVLRELSLVMVGLALAGNGSGSERHCYYLFRLGCSESLSSSQNNRVLFFLLLDCN